MFKAIIIEVREDSEVYDHTFLVSHDEQSLIAKISKELPDFIKNYKLFIQSHIGDIDVDINDIVDDMMESVDDGDNEVTWAPSVYQGMGFVQIIIDR